MNSYVLYKSERYSQDGPLWPCQQVSEPVKFSGYLRAQEHLSPPIEISGEILGDIRLIVRV